MPEIMISAGEVSGDMHAASLVNELMKLYPCLKVWGLGGNELKKSGTEIICNTVEESVMGLLEPLKKIAFYLYLLRRTKREIVQRNPDVIILVDFTAFNMKLAKFGYKTGIPVVSFFSPAAWVWGRRRAVKMAHWKVRIASVLPMEHDVYKAAGADVSYVGHPIPLEIKKRMAETGGFQEMETNKGTRTTIGLFPGSREKEIKALLTVFLQAAEIIHCKIQNSCFVIPVAAPHLRPAIEGIIKKFRPAFPLKLVDSMSCNVIHCSSLIIAASGTVTLEAACLGVPVIAAYRTSLLTALFIKFSAKVKYMSLPNLILDEKVVPEFFQKKVQGEPIAKEALKILENNSYTEVMQQKLSLAASMLGDGYASARTAAIIATVMKERGNSHECHHNYQRTR